MDETTKKLLEEIGALGIVLAITQEKLSIKLLDLNKHLHILAAKEELNDTRQ